VKDLRQRAIDVAKAELDKKADLSFTYKPTKVGRRRITGWTFKVRKNRPRPVQRQLPLRVEPELSPEQVAEAKAARRAAVEAVEAGKQRLESATFSRTPARK